MIGTTSGIELTSTGDKNVNPTLEYEEPSIKEYNQRPNPDTFKGKLMRKAKDKLTFSFNRRSMITFFVMRIPIFGWLPKYDFKHNLAVDILGGTTVGIMSIPQGIAYAKLANMPIVSGLYVNVVPTLVYIMLGTSRHAAIGAATVLSLMMGALKAKVLPCDDGCAMNVPNVTQNYTLNPVTSLEIGSANAFLVGCFLIGMGLARLDIATTYLSDQIINGFVVGVAIHIFTAQMGTAFGVKVQESSGPGKIINDYAHLFEAIYLFNYITAITCWLSVSFLAFVKLYINRKLRSKLPLPIPGELIVVAFGCLISYYTDLNKRFDVKVVGNIPASLPMPMLPRLELIKQIYVDSFIIAIVTYCQSVSQAKAYARSNDYLIDGQQEFFAYGAMNIISSFFQCFNSGLSVSRTVIYEKSGAKSQVAAAASVVIVVIAILFVAPYLSPLPSGILASIIIVACIDLFLQIKVVIPLWKTSKFDLAIYVATLLAIVLLDVTYGLLFSVLFAFFTVVLRTQRKKLEETAILPAFVVQSRHFLLNQLEMSCIKVYRFDAPLYYANVETFKAKLIKQCHFPFPATPDKSSTCRLNLKKSATSVFENQKQSCSEHENPSSALVRHVILDCSGFIYIDLMGANTLKQLYKDFEKLEIVMSFANVNAYVQKTLHKSNFFDAIPLDCLFPSVNDAVLKALENNRNCLIHRRDSM